jgi:lysophospholipase L1-like esterase
MICPPPTAASPVFANIFNDVSIKISKKLPRYFKEFAEESGVDFLDAGKVIRSSKVDGIHLDPEEHQKLAAAVAAAVKKQFGL